MTTVAGQTAARSSWPLPGLSEGPVVELPAGAWQPPMRSPDTSVAAAADQRLLLAVCGAVRIMCLLEGRPVTRDRSMGGACVGTCVFGVVPRGEPAGNRAENQEDGEAEQGGQDHRADQHIRLQPFGIDVNELADARLALLEEEVTDDRSDDRQTRGDPQPRENCRTGRRHL